ncbi:hypothetical protein KM043_016666 [Ampulex compressa]|nr:hypothetical protein KM043_016666 [Ampulex compressa]
MVVRRKVSVFVKKCGKNVTKYLSHRTLCTNVRVEKNIDTRWKSTVGLEIHAQIASKSKLFSNAGTNFACPVNSSVALFDCAMPGTMPVLNRNCVEAGVLTAIALSCQLQKMSMFERKHYFYADLPAGFQITQQKQPLAINGELQFYVFTPGKHQVPYLKSSKIKQIQLEQDSGKSLHNNSTKRSLIDLNRAGVPLMELVFEPDLVDGEEAAALVKELILIFEILGTCSCKMEEGALRIDANVSVCQKGEPLGVRTEIKNIASVRGVAAAVQHEITRQISILEKGGKIVNETLTWDASGKKNISLREKEEKYDYRFMPETNLPPLCLHIDKDVKNTDDLVDVLLLQEQIPVLPHQMRHKLKETFHLTPAIITALMSDISLVQYFFNIVEKGTLNPQLVGNFIVNEVQRFLHKHRLNMQFCIDHQYIFEELMALLQNKQINCTIARQVLNIFILDMGKLPMQIIEEKNWYLIRDEKRLEELCLIVINQKPYLVKKYKAGKMKYFTILVHNVLQLTEQCADSPLVIKIMQKLLN